MLPIDLTIPLAWKQADPDQLKMLQNLQGNILKSHGREHTVNLFFRLDPTQAQRSRRVLRELANFHLTCAHQQLLDTEHHKADPAFSGGAFVHLALAFAGYDALARAGSAPGDPLFQAGMGAQARARDLGDDFGLWEPGLAQDLHGLLLVGHDSPAEAAALADQLKDLLGEAGASVAHRQVGQALKNGKGIGIEHFGYVDGRSQPLMLEEDLEAENTQAGSTQWDPRFPLRTALLLDPGAVEDPAHSFGSYFIFRKLEQDVRGFKSHEQDLADDLNLIGEARELAGALVVGRFEDGTPVTMADDASDTSPKNNFNYAADAGSRCPFHAHIRKVNPRSTSSPLEAERERIMPRRGIPFEDQPRGVHPDHLPEVRSHAEFDLKVRELLPEGGVGLLFMAYNRDIGEQFHFVQEQWANAAGFPNPGTGIDPVIGQGAPASTDQLYAEEWDDGLPPSVAAKQPFSGFVTMRGGEYFFSPSLSFLRSL